MWWRIVFWATVTHFVLFCVIAWDAYLPEAPDSIADLTYFPCRSAGFATAAGLWLVFNNQWLNCALILSDLVVLYLTWRLVRRGSGARAVAVFAGGVILIVGVYGGAVVHLVMSGPILTPQRGFELDVSMGMIMVWSALLCCAPALLMPIGLLRFGRELSYNLCAHCGYDLRATPDAEGPLPERCPECGAAALSGPRAQLR
jgi:hypothetical protein